MGQIGYEIDFLPVGNGERSGDAIAIRLGTSINYLNWLVLLVSSFKQH